MVFSSMIFVWMFLPLVFLAYRVTDKKYQNVLLLLVSILFYAWGEPVYVVLMVVSISINYAGGLLLDHLGGRTGKQRAVLCAVILLNLGILGYFKYYDFFIANLNALLGRDVFSMRNIVLPIGISFYTFQAMSYVIDLYRGNARVQKNYLNLALYVSFFPQLIAGPIVKYHDVDEQIRYRQITREKTAEGIRRFIYGLGKKVLIANAVALCADKIFALKLTDVTGGLAWIGAIFYTIQIYYDFSGYSDMAIGLGKMFGFDFLENFQYPYTSLSIKEFWRRWHISMSTWFKEYVYIPLGGNRKGTVRTLVNMGIVFFTTGLWHGASWNYVLWGLYHGFFLILERLGLGKVLEKCRWKWVNRLYSLLVIIVGWMLFRNENLGYALGIIQRMFLPWLYTAGNYAVMELVSYQALAAACFGILGCGWIQRKLKENKRLARWKYGYGELLVCGLIFALCILQMASNTYSPFIYFRF